MCLVCIYRGWGMLWIIMLVLGLLVWFRYVGFCGGLLVLVGDFVGIMSCFV